MDYEILLSYGWCGLKNLPVSVLHIPFLIKRSKVQKDCYFSRITEIMGSTQEYSIPLEITKILIRKSYTLLLLLSTLGIRKPTGIPAIRQVFAHCQRVIQCLQPYLFDYSIPMPFTKIPSEASTFWSQILSGSISAKGGSKYRATTFGIKPKLNVGCVRVVVEPVPLPFRGSVPHASQRWCPPWLLPRVTARSEGALQEAARATPAPFSSFPWEAPPRPGPPLWPPARRPLGGEGRGAPGLLSAVAVQTVKRVPREGRKGGARRSPALPPAGLPSTASYTLQPPRFLAEEPEALRPAAVPHRMPPRRRFSSSSLSKPTLRPGSRIRAARAEWGFGDQGRASWSATAWGAEVTGGTGARNKGSGYSTGHRVGAAWGRSVRLRDLDSLAVLMAPRSPRDPNLAKVTASSPRKKPVRARRAPRPRPPVRPGRRLAAGAATPPASPGPQ